MALATSRRDPPGRPSCVLRCSRSFGACRGRCGPGAPASGSDLDMPGNPEYRKPGQRVHYFLAKAATRFTFPRRRSRRAESLLRAWSTIFSSSTGVALTALRVGGLGTAGTAAIAIHVGERVDHDPMSRPAIMAGLRYRALKQNRPVGDSFSPLSQGTSRASKYSPPDARHRLAALRHRRARSTACWSGATRPQLAPRAESNPRPAIERPGRTLLSPRPRPSSLRPRDAAVDAFADAPGTCA